MAERPESRERDEAQAIRLLLNSSVWQGGESISMPGQSITDRCAMKVTVSPASIQLGQRTLGPNDAFAEGVL